MTNAPVTPGVNTMLLTKEHLDAMGRRRFQSPRLQQTEGEKPKWFCRYYKDVRHANGKLDRVEDRKYFGFVHEVKPTAAQAMELLIHVAGNLYVIDGRVVQLLNESEAPMIEHDNTLAGIAFAICRAVCRAKGIDEWEVE